jgi:hypothetical protein
MELQEPIEEKGSKDQPKANQTRSRRRPVGNGNAKKTVENSQEEKAGDKPVRRRRQYKITPVSNEMVGTKAVGKILDIIKKHQSSYGFILIDVEGSKSEKLRIYFNMTDYKETQFPARRGYQVQFTVETDDKDRMHAADITLTTEGKVVAEEREAKIAATKADPSTAAEPKTNGKAKTNGDAETKKPRRPRNPANDESVTLNITCDGKPEKVPIEVKLYQSIGKLKYAAVEKFQVPMTYVIYCQRTPENPAGEKLTKTILRTLKDGDDIFIGPPTEASPEA